MLICDCVTRRSSATSAEAYIAPPPPPSHTHSLPLPLSVHSLPLFHCFTSRLGPASAVNPVVLRPGLLQASIEGCRGAGEGCFSLGQPFPRTGLPACPSGLDTQPYPQHCLLMHSTTSQCAFGCLDCLLSGSLLS